MSRPLFQIRRVFRPAAHRRVAVGAGSLLVAAVTVGSVLAAPAQAQTSALDVRIVAGANARATGGLITGLTVSNLGIDALTNVQVVVRVPAVPVQIQNVTEASAPLADSSQRIGVVDERTGMWFHTIASLPAGTTVNFNVNWFDPCAGRWPFAARAGDRRTSVSYQFSGSSALSCGPDDLSAPTPAAWFELPWPPSTGPTTAVTSTSTTVVGAIATIPQAGGTTLPGATSSTTSSLVAASSTLPPTTRATTRRATTTRRPATTLEIVCKTVGGRRYCGPKSSALKPGQAKPRAVAPTTKKKSAKS